ncbi:hypothetical protein L901_11480 [Agrobacterium sp. D14]|nr:hypothetical protein L901_11480 [Agrobacterium sp. D14]
MSRFLRGAFLLPISPLEGEMPGRAEGGIFGFHACRDRFRLTDMTPKILISACLLGQPVSVMTAEANPSPTRR